VFRVGNGHGNGIAKNRGRFLKADGVLGQIGSGLVRVPFKLSMGNVEPTAAVAANKKIKISLRACVRFGAN
jgi:hypothetical protein